MTDENIRMRITLEMAREVSKWLIDKTSKDGDKPIAVTIVGPDGITILQEAMEGVKGISPELSRKKAWTSIMVQCDTIELDGLNPMNFANPDVTCFPGGILIQTEGPKYKTEIVGAVGVSGRKGKQSDGIATLATLQDHELALQVAKRLAIIVQEDWAKRYNMR
jgi:uncharacterized protein GlcG (DUF336 family)